MYVTTTTYNKYIGSYFVVNSDSFFVGSIYIYIYNGYDFFVDPINPSFFFTSFVTHPGYEVRLRVRSTKVRRHLVVRVLGPRALDSFGRQRYCLHRRYASDCRLRGTTVAENNNLVQYAHKLNPNII